MATALVNPKFRAWNGDKPLAFGKVYTYAAGTNIPKPTYTSEDETVVNPNPVILNAEGYADIYLDGSYKVVVKDEDDVEVWTADPVTDITTVGNEWVHPTPAEKYDVNKFKVNDNQVDRFHPGRRVKLDDTGYLYGDIVQSYYDGQGFTVVEVVLDSGSMTANLNQAYVGIISAVNGAQPANKYLENLQGDQGTDYIKYASDKTLTEKIDEQDAEDQNLQDQIDVHTTAIAANAQDIVDNETANAQEHANINAEIIQLQGAITSGNKLTYRTRADLFADLAHDADTVAEVYLDPTAEYNGVYLKNGASGTGSWTIASYDRYQEALANSKKGRYLVLGEWSKCERVAANNYLLSNNRMYILTDSGTISIATQTDVTITNGQVLYVDPVNGSQDGSSAYIPQIATIGTGNWASEDKYVLFSCSNDIVGGIIPPIANMKSISDRFDVTEGLASSGYDNSRRSRYIVLGEPSKLIRNPADSQELIVSWGAIRIKDTASGGFKKVQPVTDLVVPATAALLVDFDAATDGNGDLVVTVADPWYSHSSYGDPTLFNKMFLLTNYYGTIGGAINFGAVGKIDGSRISNIARYQLLGGLTSYGTVTDTGNTVSVTYPELQLFIGSTGQVPLAIRSQTNQQIPINECLYVDLDAGPDGDGKYTAQVTSGGYVSTIANGTGAFVKDGKYPLLFNGSNSLRGGPLLENSRFTEGLGGSIIPWGNCTITFDASTRTLSWTGDIYFLYRGGNRLRLNAGSFTFPDGNDLQTCYLSLKDVNDWNNATASLCIKSGRYYTGTDRYYANPDQIPLFWYSGGKYGPMSGFPQPDIVGVPQDGNTAPVVVVVYAPTADTQRMDVHIRDDGNPNGRYIRWRFERVNNPGINSDVWHVQKAWVVNNALSSTILEVLTGGEIETAIKESGKADFVGGTAHGDEKTLSVVFHLDGEVLDPAVAGVYQGEGLRVQQVSQCYEEGTGATVNWFKAYKSWQFGLNGVEITQQSEFERDANIDSFYNCFLTIARNEDVNNEATTSQYGAQYPKYETVDLIPRNHARNYIDNVKRAIAWGGGVFYEAEFIEGYNEQDPDNTEYSPSINEMFFQADSSAYNKMYFRQGFTQIRTGAVIFNRYRYKITSSL